MRVPTPALAPAPSLSSASSYASCRPTLDELEFPAGLRVLVVDDDLACLRILDHMLQRCRYQVTTCCQAAIALSLLREKKGGYDVVISDVHMPDMDGFKLLELVGLEMDLPVIMMSADGGTDTVMRGIKHGACDYLIKPVRMEELKNIWQHVIRKKCNGNKEQEHSSSFEDSDRRQHMVDDVDYSSSVNDGTDGTWRSHKKKRDVKEDEDGGELENEDPSAPKRPRVVWSVELHQQFVSAVNQLGIDKAVPKRILELMNVPGLTRENIASHLQKFRLYLKRLHGVAQHHGAISNSFCGSVESNAQVGPLDRLDFQALAASGQIPPQTLAALHAELLGRPSGGHVFPAISKPVLLQGSVQGPKHNHIKPEVAYGQPLLKSQSNISKQIFQANFAVEDMSSGCSMWSSDHLGTTASNRVVNSNHSGNLVMQMLEKKQPYTMPPEPNHAINVQPSCLVVPSVSSNSFQMGRSSVSLNESTIVAPSQASSGIHVGLNPAIAKQNSCRNNNMTGDHIQLSSLSCEIPFGEAQIPDGDFKNASVLDGYPTLGSQSSSISFSSAHPNGNPAWRIHSSPSNAGSVSRLTNNLPDMCILGSESKIAALPTQGNGRYHGFVGKDTCIPSRFAVDDVESPNGDRVKPGFHLDFTDNSKFVSNVLPYYSANDAMGVLSKDGLAGCFLKS